MERKVCFFYLVFFQGLILDFSQKFEFQIDFPFPKSTPIYLLLLQDQNKSHDKKQNENWLPRSQ